jgi:hypothetical protein
MKGGRDDVRLDPISNAHRFLQRRAYAQALGITERDVNEHVGAAVFHP